MRKDKVNEIFKDVMKNNNQEVDNMNVAKFVAFKFRLKQK